MNRLRGQDWQGVSLALETQPAECSPPLTAPCGQRWLVGPWFDLLFVANVGWPLIVLWQWGDEFEGRAGVLFWQVYFVTTPHRWITLGLVFLDRERFRQRRGAFLGIAAAAVVICGGVRLATGTLTCLLALDYVWNAWHFAAQHHGVLRIYARVARIPIAAGWDVEKWALRGFLLYVALRVAVATWTQPEVEAWLQLGDGGVLAVPVWLVATRLIRRRGGSVGELLYLVSVLSLYVSLLWAVHLREPRVVLMLATASALFHATEYLAVVGWAVRRRAVERGGAMGLLGWLAPRWGLALGLYLMVLGSVGWVMDRELLEVSLLINVVVAFLHYAYDGLIWRGAPTVVRST